MNIEIRTPIVSDGSQHAIVLQRGYCHSITVSASSTLQTTPTGPSFPLQADVLYSFRESLGQMIYVTSPAGTTINMLLD